MQHCKSTILQLKIKWFLDFPVVKWLRLYPSTAGGTGSIPGLEIKIPHAAWHGQKNNNNKIKEFSIYAWSKKQKSGSIALTSLLFEKWCDVKKTLKRGEVTLISSRGMVFNCRCENKQREETGAHLRGEVVKHILLFFLSHELKRIIYQKTDWLILIFILLIHYI